jgi:stearoyl-CoA desaturase (delta-9 desaturase)
MLAFIYTLVMVQITIACVTLYLHRSQAHRAVSFHPAVNHFMRFWLWMTTGMVTKEWVAIHRKHHQAADTPADPHSPTQHGIWRVLFTGAALYVKASKNKILIQELGQGTPNDWIEEHIYSKHSRLGILLMLVIDLVLFGPWGLLIWGIQMIWIPFWAAGVINGLAHWWGYRNYSVKDTSRNITPWAFWIGGEELHNNHHGDGASAKFSKKRWEFDIGWMYIRILKFLRLAKVRDVPSSSV